MALLVAIVGILLLVALIAYFWGAWKLAQYGFRLSTGTGLAVLLFPPYTIIFASKLQQSGKETPLAACLFGIISAALLISMFTNPLRMLLTGQMDQVIAAEEAAEKAALDAQLKEGVESTSNANEVPVRKIEKAEEVKNEAVVVPPTPTTGTPEVTTAEPVKTEPGKAEPAKAESAKTEPVKAEPTKVEPQKTDAKAVEQKPDAPK